MPFALNWRSTTGTPRRAGVGTPAAAYSGKSANGFTNATESTMPSRFSPLDSCSTSGSVVSFASDIPSHELVPGSPKRIAFLPARPATSNKGSVAAIAVLARPSWRAAHVPAITATTRNHSGWNTLRRNTRVAQPPRNSANESDVALRSKRANAKPVNTSTTATGKVGYSQYWYMRVTGLQPTI